MKTAIKTVLSLAFLAIVSSLLYNFILSIYYGEAVINEFPGNDEIKEVNFIFQLKEEQGSEIWPGFDTTDIPVILFNDKYEFLITRGSADDSWSEIACKKSMRRSIYRRPAVNPQAFAVKVNGAWAGSAGCPAQMNREMFWGIRSEMPAFINRLFPFFLIEISHDMHVSGVIHEIFHAFQAIRNETKFFHAERSHAGLKTYPGDPLFREYWDKEGIFLLRALNAKDRQELLSAVKAFLLTRKERRIRCNLPEDLISMEKDLEWLEGLAKYAEIRSYIVAADQEDRPFHFKKKNPYWQLEQKQRLRSLGASDGDNRFYHSGAAQAFILDKIHPGWKEEIMNDSIYLEDLLVQHTKGQTTAL